jgi:hypothetical protein
MTEHRSETRVQGDAGELNRGLGQARVGQATPGPLENPHLAPAAGGPGSGSGEGTQPSPPSGDPDDTVRRLRSRQKPAPDAA